MSLITEEMKLLADLQDRQPFGVSVVQRLKRCNYFKARVMVDELLDRGLIESDSEKPWSFTVKSIVQ